MMIVLDWAMQFLGLGIAVFPVHYRNKTPKIKWEIYQDELPEASQVYRWFAGGSLHNYGVVSGWQNLTILDFDDMQKWYDWNIWVLDQPDDSPASIAASMAFKVQTARGMHVYLQIPEQLNNMHINGLDIKKHGYVLGPGSTHPSSVLYSALSENLIIPLVNNLADVFPADWWAELQHPVMPENVAGGYSVGISVPDPFEAATMCDGAGRDVVAQIRERHKLQNFIYDVVKTGDHWYMGRCPFHPDKNPSFWIDDTKQIGNCQKCNFPRPFDVINLFAQIQRVSNQDAIQILRAM
jgi:hypothetical protein